MLEKIFEPVAKAGVKVLSEGGKILAKEGVRQGAKIGGIIISHIIAIILTIILTSKYKDKVYKELCKKHDKETAERLTEQFQSEINALKKEIAQLKIEKKEVEQKLREGIERICRKYEIDPNIVLKKKKTN